ncbi:helix-turn-helix domain-containing protein, partial [Pseudomonas syringae group genomosp. 3]
GLYRGRKPNAKVHEQIIALKGGGCSIAETARLAGVSVSQVKRVWSQYLAAKADV